MFRKDRAYGIFPNGMTIPVILAILQFTLQTIFHGNYGYFRDELCYIACSNHLAFGYVDQPPLSITILWVNRMLLGVACRQQISDSLEKAPLARLVSQLKMIANDLHDEHVAPKQSIEQV